MRTAQFAVILLVISLCCTAHAVTISTVPIGNPGNPADARYIESYHPSGVGSVAYSFNIGKTEVTNVQYVAFLNAVATSDAYGLYSASMASDTFGGIVRSGVTGGFTYAVKAPALTGTYTYDDKPVVFVNSGDAMRFANWLHNGQPTGMEDASTTEDGAYTLSGAVTDAALAAVTRNSGARWWLPSEDEWYKAAYHKNDGATGNYWDYATGTNSRPDDSLPSQDTGNSANFSLGCVYSYCYMTGDRNYPMSDAGAYTLSGSAYGTFDQNGNAWELNETLFVDSVSSRGLRGGAWSTESNYLQASRWIGTDPTYESTNIGFRVVMIATPEPGTILLTMSGLCAILRFRTIRRRSR